MLQVGGALAGIAATVASGFWIYVLQSEGDHSFLEWPGILGVTLFAFGAIMMVVGLLGHPDTNSAGDVRQHQEAGDFSRNQQAGRDLRIEPGKEEE